MSRISVVGAGMMGSALCVPLIDAGHDVRLIGTPLDGEIIASLRADGVHPRLKAPLPAGVQFFAVEELAQPMADAEVIALGVSSAGVPWAADAIAPFVRSDTPVFMITKGLHWDGQELRLLPDVLAARLASRATVCPVAVAGPCIAGELARRVETCVVFAGRDGAVARRLAALCSTPYYHARSTDDVAGAEVGAALKNAFAMGIAFAIGLHERRGGAAGSVAMHNYESAVFAEAAVEMQHLAHALGGKTETVLGLCGVGDLDVTCNGGRTGRFGRLLGLGLTVAEAQDRMEGATLECLEVLAVLRDALPTLEERGRLSRNKLPLLSHLVEVALNGAPIAMPFSRFFSE